MKKSRALCPGGVHCHHDPKCPKAPETLSDVIQATGRYDLDTLQKEVEDDMVVNPKHYELAPGLDAMDVIRMVLGEEGWKAYCKGNMLKYLLRKKWNADEDVAKTGRYADMYKGEIRVKDFSMKR